LKKIDFADLIDAKQRFLTADNATIAISGNFDKALGFRATRRYFGGWLKADKKVPSTFRQPDEPDTKPFGVTIAGTGNSQVRFALRSVSRSDKDYAASEKILLPRLQNFSPKGLVNNFLVSNNAHTLPGILILGYSSGNQPVVAMPVNTGSTASRPGALPQDMVSLLLLQTVTDAEFVKSSAEITAETNHRTSADADTYKLVSVTDDTAAFQNLTIADVRRVAGRLSKNPIVMVSVTQTETVSK
jgi:hypothetical protein